jgi:hypothetical protein
MQRAWCSLARLDGDQSILEIAVVARTTVYVSFTGSSQALQGRSLKKC